MLTDQAPGAPMLPPWRTCPAYNFVPAQLQQAAGYPRPQWQPPPMPVIVPQPPGYGYGPAGTMAGPGQGMQAQRPSSNHHVHPAWQQHHLAQQQQQQHQLLLFQAQQQQQQQQQRVIPTGVHPSWVAQYGRQQQHVAAGQQQDNQQQGNQQQGQMGHPPDLGRLYQEPAQQQQQQQGLPGSGPQQQRIGATGAAAAAGAAVPAGLRAGLSKKARKRLNQAHRVAAAAAATAPAGGGAAAAAAAVGGSQAHPGSGAPTDRQPPGLQHTQFDFIFGQQPNGAAAGPNSIQPAAAAAARSRAEQYFRAHAADTNPFWTSAILDPDGVISIAALEAPPGTKSSSGVIRNCRLDIAFSSRHTELLLKKEAVLQLWCFKLQDTVPFRVHWPSDERQLLVNQSLAFPPVAKRLEPTKQLQAHQVSAAIHVDASKRL